MTDRVLFQPEIARPAPLVDDRSLHRTHAKRADPLELDRGRLHVLETPLGIVTAQVLGWRVVIDEHDVEAGAAEVVLHDAHVIAEVERVGLARLARRVGDVDDESLRVGDRARDLGDEEARAHRGEEAARPERDEVGRLDRLDAAGRGRDVVVLEEDAFDRRLADGADVHLFLDDAAVGEFSAEVRVVEGHREDSPAQLEKPRRLFDSAQERAFLLGERGEEEVTEGHAVQLFGLLRVEAVRHEPREHGVALGEDDERVADVAGRGHVEGDAHLAGRPPRVGDRDESSYVRRVRAQSRHDRRRAETAADAHCTQRLVHRPNLGRYAGGHAGCSACGL